MNLILKIFNTLFISKNIGIIFQKIFSNIKSKAIEEISDPENQKKAIEFVKELNGRKDCSVKEKAEFFNLKMMVYAQDKGKKLSTCVINCLRELAVTALKED